ncbi:MAG: hypothetical protein IJI46_09410 [Erysipelotrichaceae bacterium]|nr:hypothetical protein [Erysipelotrichaceae bacterium]
MLLVLVSNRSVYYDDFDDLHDQLCSHADKLEGKDFTHLLDEMRNNEFYIYSFEDKHFFNADTIFRKLANEIQSERRHLNKLHQQA